MLKFARRQNAIKLEGEQSSSLDLARSRLMLLGMGFACVYIIIAMRTIDLGVIQGSPRVQGVIAQNNNNIKPAEALRGNIYDRNGILLATTIKTASLFVDPALIIEPEKVAKALHKIFPDLSVKQVMAEMHEKKRFAWVRRNITPAQQQKILELGEPGLAFEYENRRIYPQGKLAAHLIGFTDRDGLGLAGIERSYEKTLANGEDVTLSLDMRLQHVAKREVQKAIDDFTAKGGVGLIMDVKTGELLAGASLPDFDLNAYSASTDDQRFSRMTLGVYELGSMFKIFSTAALFEKEQAQMSDTFDATQPIKIGRFRISDYHAQKRWMTVPEVFMHSSNIGTAKMGQKVGSKRLHDFYADLGLLEKLKFDISELGAPLVPSAPWSLVSTLTISYGHGVSTSPLQMAAAVSGIVNGGLMVRPTLLKQDPKEDPIFVRVVSEETSMSMRKLMRLVVTQGTGKNADVPGYEIGGKTGTAEKSVNGRYERKKLISSFVGAFPMNDPRYVVMVMVDEPVGNKKSYGYATAGWVAAPAVGRVVMSMASILGIPADHYDAAQDISLDLLPYVQGAHREVQVNKALGTRAITVDDAEVKTLAAR